MVAIVALGAALLVSPASGQSPASAPRTVQQQPPAGVVPIPVPEIAQRAEDVARLLRQNAERLAADEQVRDLEERLGSASEWIGARTSSTTGALVASPSPGALATLAESWTLMRGRLAEWNQRLTRRAVELERELSDLDGLRTTWSVSRTAALASGAPAPVIERIDATLGSIVTARDAVGTRRARVLDFQDRVVKEIDRCDTLLATIARARGQRIRPLSTRDSPAIWSPEARALTWDVVGPQLSRSLADTAELARDYFAGQLDRVPLHVGLFVVVLMLVGKARRRARERVAAGACDPAEADAVGAPVSAALALGLLATGWIYPDLPQPVAIAVGLLLLPPVVLIVRRLAPPTLHPAIQGLAVLFLLDRVREGCAVVPPLEQWVLLAEMAFGIAFLAYAARSEALLAASGRRRVVVWILRAQLAMLTGAIAAGVLGYTQLARLASVVVVSSDYAGLVLYAGARVAGGIVAYLLGVPPLATLRMVRRHQGALQRRLHRAIQWLAAGAWIYLTLESLGAADGIVSAAKTALSARYVRGSVDLSLADVLVFGLTIAAAFGVSALVRFVLAEDVYPRTGVADGAAYALSSLLHYAVVLAGLLLAVFALGVDLTRVTILAGALGVGIGIGLQHVVANFVAGLVILLEHRIHVGDSIETGDLAGEVRDIGLRASTVRTWAGAEVVVPNGRLTSERVINWTLSDRRRRVDVPVTVAYTCEPPHVLDVLRKTGEAHPKALPDPSPEALCTGFHDNGLQFELRVWTGRFEEAETVRSEVAMAVHAALAAARIDLGVPRHDVRLRNDRTAADPRPDGGQAP